MKTPTSSWAPVGAALALAFAVACGGSDATIDAAGSDAGIVDAGSIDASCFEDPQTYLELINACTDAVQIDKRPVLPLQLPDGSLPPLPE
ncbi:MAG: hypothetical protein R2939_19405 [Kofleriaceae bacterium]